MQKVRSSYPKSLSVPKIRKIINIAPKEKHEINPYHMFNPTFNHKNNFSTETTQLKEMGNSSEGLAKKDIMYQKELITREAKHPSKKQYLENLSERKIEIVNKDSFEKYYAIESSDIHEEKIDPNMLNNNSN